MIDGLMKAFFGYAKIPPDKAREMVENTYKVVEGIGNDLAQLRKSQDEMKASIEAMQNVKTQ